jgi:hypothetical protein
MPAEIPVIWFKSNNDPQSSFASSLWITLHTQIYNYTHASNYIMRINNINSALTYDEHYGFLMDNKTLFTLSSMINRNLRRMKIKEFSFSLSEDNDIRKAINYMEKGRPVVIGIPYKFLAPLVKYNVINNDIPESIIYYLTCFVYEGRIILIPGFEGVELKTGIDDFYSRSKDQLKDIGIDEFIEYCEKIESKIKIVYANVLARNGEELRSLNEY